MANMNHDELGRFAVGQSVGINLQKAYGKAGQGIKPFKGKVVRTNGNQVTVRSGNKEMTAHKDHIFADKSGQDKAFRKSLAARNADVAAAHATAAAKIVSDGHTGQAGVSTRMTKARESFYKDTATLYDDKPGPSKLSKAVLREYKSTGYDPND